MKRRHSLAAIALLVPAALVYWTDLRTMDETIAVNAPPKPCYINCSAGKAVIDDSYVGSVDWISKGDFDIPTFKHPHATKRATNANVYRLTQALEIIPSGPLTVPVEALSTTMGVDNADTPLLRPSDPHTPIWVWDRPAPPQPNEPLPAVPEPSTWALMIAGFAMIGRMMRLTRKTAYVD